MPESTAAAEKLARRYVWWEPPSRALADPRKLLCQILKMGTAEDYVAAVEIWGEQAFRDASQNALPGEVDGRSWAFWRRYYGMENKPPPRRTFA